MQLKQYSKLFRVLWSWLLGSDPHHRLWQSPVEWIVDLQNQSSTNCHLSVVSAYIPRLSGLSSECLMIRINHQPRGVGLAATARVSCCPGTRVGQSSSWCMSVHLPPGSSNGGWDAAYKPLSRCPQSSTLLYKYVCILSKKCYCCYRVHMRQGAVAKSSPPHLPVHQERMALERDPPLGRL